MSADWKPGDLAAISFDGLRETHRCIRVNSEMCGVGHHLARDHWHHIDGTSSWSSGEGDAIRPLILIDPEGPEVNRLIALLGTAWFKPIGHMRDALRSLIEPPRPDEPTGKYAIVVADGVAWCRAAWASNKPWSRIGTDVFASWDEMDVESIVLDGSSS